MKEAYITAADINVTIYDHKDEIQVVGEKPCSPCYCGSCTDRVFSIWLSPGSLDVDDAEVLIEILQNYIKENK